MESIWSKETKFPNRPQLEGNIYSPVAIIGAGIAGILTAYFLKNEGINCVILERGQACIGQTKNTTAKITAQHGAIYSKLIKTVGEKKAAEYHKLNKQAINDFESIIKHENISCDFERLPSAIYSMADDKIIREEAKAAATLGIEHEIKSDCSLPFSVALSLVFPNQAQFDPLKFLKPLCEGLTIFENTNVLSVHDNIITTDCGTVKADKIAFSSHYPFINFPGLYFMRMHQERSYVLALKNAQKLDMMYYGIDPNSFSFRPAGDLLLFGGRSHRTGKNQQRLKYAMLETEAKKLWHDCEVYAKWSAQDCISGDGIPFIGNFSKGKKDWFVQTGFNKWGMTSSMAAARLTAQSIAKRESQITVFSPSRKLNLPTVKEILINTAEAAKGLTEKFCFATDDVEDIENGSCAVCDIDGEKKGVYKDEAGKLHIVSLRCPHLGCELKWNGDEKSWDCPCHGSRFDINGKLICEPAQTDIE